MTESTLKISGMTCNHCVMAVEKELKKLPVTQVAVSIGEARVTYDECTVAEARLHAAIEEAGYAVVSAQNRVETLGDVL